MAYGIKSITIGDDTIENKGGVVYAQTDISSLPVTISNTKITDKMYAVSWYLTNPKAQKNRWTVVTSNGSCTISGQIEGHTTLRLWLSEYI